MSTTRHANANTTTLFYFLGALFFGGALSDGLDRLKVEPALDWGKMIYGVLGAGDFTTVCNTELGKWAAYTREFEKRVKLLGASCNDLQSHSDWMKDIKAYSGGCEVNFLLVLDPNREAIT